jgi:hypothetical protein
MLNFVRTIGGTGRKLEMLLLKESTTFTVGQAVRSYVTGAVEGAAAALPVLGVLVGIVDSKGTPFRAGNIVPGTAFTNELLTVTTAGGNATYYGLVDISADTVYSAAVNGTVGTTVDSELRGAKIDIDSAGGNLSRVLESTATRTVATAANFYSHGADPLDGTRLLVSIGNSEFGTYRAA